MSDQFCPMRPEEVPLMLDLIRQRIAWMDARGLEEWNVQGYLDIFPPSYFQERADAGQLYCLRRDGALAAAAVLLEQDPYWEDFAAAFYVHNLAAAPACPGAGEALLRRFMELGRSRNKAYLRLDCLQASRRLNRYYESLGFQFVRPVEDGVYLANCLQCPL